MPSFRSNTILSFFAAVLLAPFSAMAETDVVRVATDLDLAPYAFVNSQGVPEGFAVDLIKAVAKHAGLNIKIEAQPYEAISQRLRSGEIDLAPFFAKTGGGFDGDFAFSDTHTVGYDAIFVRHGDMSIVSEDNLWGKRIVAQTGSLAEAYLKQNGVIKPIVALSLVEALKLLSSGQADAFIGAQLPALAMIEQSGIDGIRMATEPRFGSYTRRYAIAVSDARVDLLDKVNVSLRAVIASGEYRDLSERWLSNLDPAGRKRTHAQQRLVAIILAATLVVAILMILVFFFRREVRRKTTSLVESQGQYRSLVENLPGAVFRCENIDGQWFAEYVSDGFEGLCGFPAADFLPPRSRTLLSVLHPDDLARVIQVRDLRPSGLDKFEVDFRIVTKSGETRWVHSRCRIRTDAQGYERYLDGLIIDVTEQKRVNSLLTEQQSRLASSARLSALGEMAGGIAHEINNPLAIINLRTHQLSQLVKRSAGKTGEYSREFNEIIASIESTTDRISKIIKSLQTVARESAQDPFEIVSVDAILGDTLELCLQRMRKHGIEVLIDDFPKSLDLECRRVQISQVLINLLNNSFDALQGIENGYVRISVRERLQGGFGLVEMAIEDNGRSIPTDIAHKIFQPFFTTKGPGKGTGLGLSISKGMIEAHDGRIWLDTSSAHTRFVILLPKRHFDTEGSAPLGTGEDSSVGVDGAW